MKIMKIILIVAANVILFCGLVLAQDNFDWLPKGGCELLFEVQTSCVDCDDIQTILKTI